MTKPRPARVRSATTPRPPLPGDGWSNDGLIDAIKLGNPEGHAEVIRVLAWRIADRGADIWDPASVHAALAMAQASLSAPPTPDRPHPGEPHPAAHDPELVDGGWDPEGPLARRPRRPAGSREERTAA